MENTYINPVIAASVSWFRKQGIEDFSIESSDVVSFCFPIQEIKTSFTVAGYYDNGLYFVHLSSRLYACVDREHLLKMFLFLNLLNESNHMLCFYLDMDEDLPRVCFRLDLSFDTQTGLEAHFLNVLTLAKQMLDPVIQQIGMVALTGADPDEAFYKVMVIQDHFINSGISTP